MSRFGNVLVGFAATLTHTAVRVKTLSDMIGLMQMSSFAFYALLMGSGTALLKVPIALFDGSSSGWWPQGHV